MKTIVIMQQDARRFVRKLDFLTTPGYLDGRGARERAGLPVDTGPHRVITQLGLYDFCPNNCRMRLCAIRPGVTTEEALGASGFDLLVAPDVGVTPTPSAEQLRIIRELDPTGLILAH